MTINSANQITIASGKKIPETIPSKIKAKKEPSFAKTMIESEINKNIDEIENSIETVKSNNNIASIKSKKYRNIEIKLLPETYNIPEIIAKVVPKDNPVTDKALAKPVIPKIKLKKPEYLATINGKSISTFKSIDMKSLINDSESDFVAFKNESKDTIIIDGNGIIYSPGKEYKIEQKYFASQQFKTSKNIAEPIEMKHDVAVLKTVFQSDSDVLTIFNSENYYRLVLGDLSSGNLIGNVQSKASLIEAEKIYELKIEELPYKYSLKPGWNMLINPHNNPVKISDLLISYNGIDSAIFSRENLILNYALVLKESVFFTCN